MSVSFDDIRAMLAAKPVARRDVPAGCAAILSGMRHAGVAVSPEWLDVIQNLARLQQKDWPAFNHPRVALYAANYGENLDEVTARLKILAAQQDPLTRLCALVNADLRVYELDLTAQIPAHGVSEEEASHAMSYGLMAVEEHVDCLIIEPISPGVDAILTAWEMALARDAGEDALNLLRNNGGGHDLFALLGAVASAYMAGIPVFCGARLGVVLPLALRRMLPDAAGFIFALPQMLVAPDAVQAIAAVQHLQVLLAFGPAPQKTGRVVSLPKIATA